MQKDSIEHIVLELGVNLWHNSLVYLPGTLVTGIKMPKRSPLFDFVDRLVMLDRDIGAYFVDQDQVTIKVMHKAVLWNDNLFKLLQYRQRYPEPAMDYLVKKYREEIDGFLLLTDWFLENVNNDIPEISSEQYNGLKMQGDILKNHIKELKDNFGGPVRVHGNGEGSRIDAFEVLREKLLQYCAAGQGKKSGKIGKLAAIREKAIRESERKILKQIFNVKFRNEK